jgi:hypothetical protein
MCNKYVYFDEEIFDKIYNRKKNDILDIEIKIKNQIKKMIDIKNEIQLLINMSKKEYIFKINSLIKKDILEMNEMTLILPFKVYCFK